MGLDGNSFSREAPQVSGELREAVTCLWHPASSTQHPAPSTAHSLMQRCLLSGLGEARGASDCLWGWETPRHTKHLALASERHLRPRLGPAALTGFVRAAFLERSHLLSVVPLSRQPQADGANASVLMASETGSGEEGACRSPGPSLLSSACS